MKENARLNQAGRKGPWSRCCPPSFSCHTHCPSATIPPESRAPSAGSDGGDGVWCPFPGPFHKLFLIGKFLNFIKIIHAYDLNSFPSFIIKNNVLLSKFNYFQLCWQLLLVLTPYLQMTSFYCLYCGCLIFSLLSVENKNQMFFLLSPQPTK